jgi:hypothetical protein
LKAHLAALGVGLALLSPVSSSADSPASMRIGQGFVDVIPHQIVRTADDRVFVFAGLAQYSKVIQAYWTSSAGLPASGASFDAAAQITESSNVFSVTAAYDGATIIHVLDNNAAGELHDHVFDVASDAFTSDALLATDMPSVAGAYLGTSGVSAMTDARGMLHVAFWSANDHVSYARFTYDPTAGTLIPAEPPTVLDSSGAANHPSLAVSPVDGSVTVAWVSQAARPARILARTRSDASGWGSEEAVSTAAVWTSPNAGINIDQGPSLLVDAAGVRFLAYIEDYTGSADYGQVHVASGPVGSAWVDQSLTGTFTHDPALGLDAAGTLYLLGHGDPRVAGCVANTSLCLKSRGADSTWGASQVLAVPTGNANFDASVSVKWAAVGLIRPETLEFVYFSADGGNYDSTSLYYGSL